VYSTWSCFALAAQTLITLRSLAAGTEYFQNGLNEEDEKMKILLNIVSGLLILVGVGWFLRESMFCR
jgi:hypothetical protein